MPTAQHAPSLSSLQRRRVALFDQGARALAAYQRRSANPTDDVTGPGSAAAVYRCPLCEQDFERAAALDGRLSLEHVPPRARGGGGIVLTCKPCNSRSGDLIDAAVVNREEQRRIGAAMLTGIGTWRGRATLHAWGEDLNVDLAIHDEPTVGEADGSTTRRIVAVTPISHWNDPAALARFQAAADATLRHEPGAAYPTYQITSRAPFYPVRARLGDLRSAYLAAFAAFGYTYALSPRLHPIRDRLRVIRDPAAVRALVPGAAAAGPEFYVDGDAPDRPAEPSFGIARLREPFAAVFVDLGAVCVVLPALDGPENPFAAMATVRPAPPSAEATASAKERVFVLEGTWLAWPTTLAAQMDLTQNRA